jgi:hypothetical protein
LGKLRVLFGSRTHREKIQGGDSGVFNNWVELTEL